MSVENQQESKYINDRQLILLMLGAASTILILGFEGLAITAIMPTIMRDLNSTTYYPLASGMSIAIQIFSTALAGIWCDSSGPRRVLISGVLIFTAGLFLSGFAQEIVLFILGRGVQGLGAGMLVVPFYVIVGSIVAPSKRPKFFVVFSASWIIPSIIGPYGASLISNTFGWRMVFIAIPPLNLLAMLLLIPMFALLKAKNEKINSKAKRILFGALGGGFFVALGQISATLPVTQMVIAVFTCLVLASISIRFALPKGCFVAKEGVASIVASRCLTLGLVIGIETLIPMVLVIGRDWKVENVALLITIGSISWFVGSYIQGRIVNKELRKKLIPIGAIVTCIGSAFGIIGVFDNISFLVLLLGWSISSIGTALIVSTCAVLSLEITPEENHGEVSSAIQVGDSYGTATLLALIGLLYTPLANAPHPWPFLPSAIIIFIFSVLALFTSFRTYSFDKKRSIEPVS